MLSFRWLHHCRYGFTTLVIPMPHRPSHISNTLLRLHYSYLTLL